MANKYALSRKELPLTRMDFGNEVREQFPEGEDGDEQFYQVRKQGDDEFFKYFVDNMFVGPGGTGKLQASVMITGQLGAGKTNLLIRLGWGIKELYGMPVSTDFTSIYPDKFGEYEYLSDQDIIDELVKVSEVSELKAKQKLTAEAVDALLAKNKSRLYKHVVLWDEIYKKVSNRRGQETLNLLVGDIMKQQRHFKSLFISAAPAQNELDRKIWNQYVNVDIEGFKLNPLPDDPRREDYSFFNVWNRATATWAPLLLYRPPWHTLYDSESPPTIRQKLNSDDLFKAIKVVYCPVCGTKHPSYYVHCPDCSSILERAARCKTIDCGAMVLPKQKYCPKCGRENDNYKGKQSKKDDKSDIIVKEDTCYGNT